MQLYPCQTAAWHEAETASGAAWHKAETGHDKTSIEYGVLSTWNAIFKIMRTSQSTAVTYLHDEHSTYRLNGQLRRLIKLHDVSVTRKCLFWTSPQELPTLQRTSPSYRGLA